jgi:hypothetical protein
MAGKAQGYLMGEPGARLTTSVRAPAVVQIIALKHAWSGVLEVSAGGSQCVDLDWFQP